MQDEDNEQVKQLKRVIERHQQQIEEQQREI
jgi:hypothetical protein